MFGQQNNLMDEQVYQAMLEIMLDAEREGQFLPPQPAQLQAPFEDEENHQQVQLPLNNEGNVAEIWMPQFFGNEEDMLVQQDLQQLQPQNFLEELLINYLRNQPFNGNPPWILPQLIQDYPMPPGYEMQFQQPAIQVQELPERAPSRPMTPESPLVERRQERILSPEIEVLEVRQLIEYDGRLIDLITID